MALGGELLGWLALQARRGIALSPWRFCWCEQVGRVEGLLEDAYGWIDWEAPYLPRGCNEVVDGEPL